MPPGGSATIASAFASATRSTVPTSSRCSGPIDDTSDDVGPRDRTELGDLPEPAHAHLGDEDLGLGLEPADRQRQADLVVLALRRPDRRHDGAAERTEDVLRRGLARGADDGDDARVALRADERRERCERCFLIARHERGGAPRGRVRDVLDAGVESDEEVTRPDDARVGLDPGDLPRPSARVRRFERARARALRPRPIRPVSRANSPGSPSRAEPRLAQRLAHDDAIVERRHHARRLLALLVPLARDHDDVVRRRRAPPHDGSPSAGRDRSRRRSRPPGGCPG